MAKEQAKTNRYIALVRQIFFDRYNAKSTEIPFERNDIEVAAKRLGIRLPKNLGDVVYSLRYRISLPAEIIDTQPEGMEWIIEGAGRAKYVFKLVPNNRIVPNEALITVKIPDSTPEIIESYALSDEQALLAKVRYNRLVDVFTGAAAYSLQNHLRTTVKNVGQIEIDEIYVGVDRRGCQFIFPVQAKGGNDQLSVVQTKQDILCCQEKFPNLLCRSISAQFMSDNRIAMFELTLEENLIQVVDEKHYVLVPAHQISTKDLEFYSQRGK